MDTDMDGDDAKPNMTAQTPACDAIHAGMRVVIHGLQSATDHNGRIGLVGDVQRSGRWKVVRDDNQQTILVKLENMKVHQAISTGTRVFVHGVTGDLDKFNGRVGVVQRMGENASMDVLVQPFAEGNGPMTTFKGVPMCNLCLMSTDFMVNGLAAKERGTTLKLKQSELSETECKQTMIVIVQLPAPMTTDRLNTNDTTICKKAMLAILNGKIKNVVTLWYTNDDLDTANLLLSYAGQCKLVLAYDPDAKVATPCCMNPMCLKACPSRLNACICGMPRYCSGLCMHKDTVHRTNCWPGVDVHIVHSV